MSVAKSYVLRLNPGQDLKSEIVKFAQVNSIASAYIGTCVGSLKKLNIRLASASKYLKLDSLENQQKTFEITSLVGTICKDGVHLHITVADDNGTCFGGHLMDDNIINTTAEIVIVSLPDEELTRIHDDKTGYKELHVKEKGAEKIPEKSSHYICGVPKCVLAIVGVSVIVIAFGMVKQKQI